MEIILSRSHLAIPDIQAKDGVSLDHLNWIGQFIVRKKPDVVIQVGDFSDLPSLSSYDKGKRSFEGRRYKKDITAAKEAMDILLGPLREYNARMRETKHAQYKPRLVLTLGNHEQRIERAVELQPELEGLMSYDDLPYEDWEVHDFLKPVVIDGILYVHYLSNPMTGKPFSGSALNQLAKAQHSFFVGHKQTLDVATYFSPAGKQTWGIVAGACLTPDHKVLTADLRYVELGSIVVGDKLTSFDENWDDSEGRSRRFKTGKVTHLKKSVKPVWKVTLESGKEFKVTEDHLWLTKLGSYLKWKNTGQLRKGTRIPKVLDEWDTDNTFEGGWLSGIYDGEGCYYTRKTCSGVVGQLGVTQKEGPVLEKIKSTLYNLFGLDNINHTRNKSDCTNMRIKGGLRGIAKVLGSLRPLRLISKFIPEHLGKMQTNDSQVDTVVSKEYIGEQEIVEIEIDAKTMVVEGYPHHNCYQHDEGYKGYQGNHHWRGVVMLNDVKDGNFDPGFISLEYLRSRYGAKKK